jgi:L-ascorbate metabolism protein UlaG (beta-lactamase superfamily)
MLALDARTAIGIHWGTFQLTDEDREEPLELLRQALANRKIGEARFQAASPGDVFDIDALPVEHGPASDLSAARAPSEVLAKA